MALSGAYVDAYISLIVLLCVTLGFLFALYYAYQTSKVAIDSSSGEVRRF